MSPQYVGYAAAFLLVIAVIIVGIAFLAGCGVQLSYMLGDKLRSRREARLLNKEYKILCETEEEIA